MKYTLIARCDRCGDVRVLEGNTSHTGENAHIAEIASKRMGLDYHPSTQLRLCSQCGVEVNEYQARQAEEFKAFASKRG